MACRLKIFFFLRSSTVNSRYHDCFVMPCVNAKHQIYTYSVISQGELDNSQSHNANVFRVDDSRSEPCVLHELGQKKMGEDAESKLLFVLSTKTTKERFLPKLCQRNGN